MAYDLTTGQRTYYTSRSALPVGTCSGVNFFDSSGNAMNCNYFKITARCDVELTEGAIVAELIGSNLGNNGNQELNAVSALSTSACTSGILGIGMLTCGNAVTEGEWHGSNGQVCTGIKVQVNGAISSIGVTYGNLFPLNTLRTTNNLIYDAGV
jgi:hypothetical protein